MKKLITLSFFVFSISLIGQVEVRPVCDDTWDLPYSLNYNGFILIDATDTLERAVNFVMRFDIVAGQSRGEMLASYTRTVPFSKNGFFDVSLGSRNDQTFRSFLEYVNENINETYFIDVYLQKGGEFEIFGTKQITTVPYSFVANALGGLGEMGRQGSEGPQGLQGLMGQDAIAVDGEQGDTGAMGQNGPDGLGIMPMRSTPPVDAAFYVDDGTNTTDGLPHLLFNNNGTWIQL